MLKALLVGHGSDLMVFLPSLLNRAGFLVIDVISIDKLVTKSKFISSHEKASNFNDVIEKLRLRNVDSYDLIVIAEDDYLKAVKNSDFSLEKKLKILPINNEKNFEHIFSKIGLSRVLSSNKINTPEFLVANNFAQAIDNSKKLGYPFFVKIDSGNGGSGVFECRNFSNLDAINKEVFNFPVLMQKKIEGTELDLSGFYRDGKLIYFTYSTIKDVVSNKFGPSVLRQYLQLGIVEKELLLEMSDLGRALGADGFVTISCMHSNLDNKRYFIEADMRPNVWVEFSRFFGDDPAIRISRWFSNKEFMTKLPEINLKYPKKMLLPYFYRMSKGDILCNRYKVFKYLPLDDFKLLLKMLYIRLEIKQYIKKISHKIAIIFNIKNIYKFIKRSPLKLVRFFVPCKNERKKIRKKLCHLFMINGIKRIFKI